MELESFGSFKHKAHKKQPFMGEIWTLGIGTFKTLKKQYSEELKDITTKNFVDGSSIDIEVEVKDNHIGENLIKIVFENGFVVLVDKRSLSRFVRKI